MSSFNHLLNADILYEIQTFSEGVTTMLYTDIHLR